MKFGNYFIITVFMATSLILHSCGGKKCDICKEEKIEYDTLFLGNPNKCDLIILRKKDSISQSKASSLWPKSTNEIRTDPIDPVLASSYIKNYNEFYNPHLTNTTFIDFDMVKLISYMSNTMLATAGSCDTLRIYMATNNMKQNSVILVGKNMDGDFFNTTRHRPIDYGGLCPPPDKSCITSKKAKLLKSAILDSRTNPPTEYGRTQIDDL